MVRSRAGERCEYCRLPSMASQAPFEVEHVIPLKHEGQTTLENLALACMHCNRHKGVNIGGLHPADGSMTRLFHPRRDDWHKHFRVKNGILTGRTKAAQVTIHVLRMNKPEQVQLRALWFSRLPP